MTRDGATRGPAEPAEGTVDASVSVGTTADPGTGARGRDGADRGRLSGHLRRLRSWLSDDPVDPLASPADRSLRLASVLALNLTLVIVLIGSPPATHTLTPLVAVAGLAVPGLARNRWFWVLLAGLFAISPLERPWLELDNHHWLQLYWFVAIVLSRFAVYPDRVLRHSARLLVGLAFLFAVVWKLVAPEFTSGAFFDSTFAADRRLGDVAAVLGLQDPGAAASNRAVVSGWRVPGRVPAAGPVEIGETITRITPVLAWTTVVIEGSVAVAFLAPVSRRHRWIRDVTMLVFVVATYPLAPVVGFGQLLLVMSAMQSDLPPRLRIGVYVTGFVGVALLSERSVALDWIGSVLGTVPG